MDDLSDIPSPSEELDDILSPAGSSSGRRSLDETTNGGTTHVNVLSPDGSAVSVTSTVGSLFGAKVRGNRTGLIFNNGLSLFDLPSQTHETVNYMYSRKRGRSSTSPILILDTDGQVALLVGSSGGTRIITTTTYVTAHALLMNTSATYANSQPRVHSEYNSTLYYDDSMEAEILDTLREAGVEDQVPASHRYPYLGVNQIIDNRYCNTCGDTCRRPCIEAVSDWRKAGEPDGY